MLVLLAKKHQPKITLLHSNNAATLDEPIWMTWWQQSFILC